MAVLVPPKVLFSPPILHICHVALPVTPKMKMIRNPTARSIPVGFRPFKRASYEAMVRQETTSGAGDWKAVEDIKTALYQSVEGVNRGVFGIPSAKKNEIEGLVKLLESQNPTPYPTEDLRKVDGCWELVYSTITILGVKRTKLGLRDFISLGDFLQTIDTAEKTFERIHLKRSHETLKDCLALRNIVTAYRIDGQRMKSQLKQLCLLHMDPGGTILWNPKAGLSFVPSGSSRMSLWLKCIQRKAVNVIKFNVKGLKMLSGELTVVASFKIVSKTRVDIEYQNSTIAPDELMNIFKKNYDILLAIFNPEGWLEITYVDETLRIGRDDKGNIFILERS